ncbi:hypothetical protein [Streptomyces sp. BPTC-684]|uniref:hypothetical protein n=1 Tax=Streptomyces sp. BPTC-684 TaxID=3043734 RepID=UPI0024B180E2|nr:hypothetical protein [Streptomyces sp. BPTC-684]WHM36287.1 hypothetical protein QIY60_04655 [Streptomyces sp. BPTC-684]
MSKDERNENGLTPEAEALRARLDKGDLADAGEPGLDELVSLGLARLEPIHGRYMGSDLHGAIAEAADRMSRLSTILAAAERESTQSGDGGIRWVPRNDLATTFISQACESATSYVWTSHPTDRRADMLAASVLRDVRMIEQGVELRTIYPDTARTRPGEIAWATAVSEAGGEVRTDEPPFMRMVAIDGDAVVVEDPAHDDSDDTALRPAYIVTHRGMVEILERAYLRQWDAADPWMGGALRRRDGTFTTRRQRKIMNYLRDGHKAVWIQKKLVISPSTYQNEISKLYKGSGMDSLFALGYWWHSDASAPERALD